MSIPKQGFFYPPTLLEQTHQSMDICQTEIFGPVLCVMKYKDEDEAVKIANDSIFGLGGGVWSEDIDRARAVAGRMRTGTVWINIQDPALGMFVRWTPRVLSAVSNSRYLSYTPFVPPDFMLVTMVLRVLTTTCTAVGRMFVGL